MPLVTLSLEAGRTREQKRLPGDAVYEALRASIQIPENDRFVAFRELEITPRQRRPAKASQKQVGQ